MEWFRLLHICRLLWNAFVVLNISCWNLVPCKPVPKDEVAIPGEDAISREAFMEECDWTGMTKPWIVAENSIQQLYLRCATGHIKWLHPEGGVRITIRAPHFASLTPTPAPQAHRICLTIFQPAFRGANLYLQDKHSLKLVFTTKSRVPGDAVSLQTQVASPMERSDSERRCVELTSPTATIFLESFFDGAENIADPGKVYARKPSSGAVEIGYDIQPVD